MKYEYNGNMLFYDRIIDISNEIIKVYPEIDKDMALKIASIEEPITDLNDNNVKFKRLYNIIYMNQYNEDIKNKVLCDMLEIYKKMDNKNIKLDNFIANMINYCIYGGEIPVYY